MRKELKFLALKENTNFNNSFPYKLYIRQCYILFEEKHDTIKNIEEECAR